MGNGKDRVVGSPVTTIKGEVIVFDNPKDSAQYQITEDLMRTLSATRSEVRDAEVEDEESGGGIEVEPLPISSGKIINISNSGHLPLPKYILQVREKRAARKKNQLPKAA